MSQFAISGITYKKLQRSTMAQIVGDSGSLNLAEQSSRNFMLTQSLLRNPAKVLTNQPAVNSTPLGAPAFGIY